MVSVKIRTMILLFSLLFYTLFMFHKFTSSRLSNPHLYQTVCDKCQLGEPVKGGEGRNIFFKDISRLCLECHAGIRLSMSHPINMTPGFDTPRDMPLDWKGEMTCTTCHFAHIDPENQADANPYYLRRNSRGKAFCLECHQHDQGPGISIGHEMALEYAHQGKESEETRSKFSLDRDSINCLGCHDGSLAVDSGGNIAGGVWRHGGPDIGNSHPVGSLYSEAARKIRLRPAEMLPDTVQLPDGKLGCLSCHNMYARNKYLLAIENVRSRLCLTCHLK